jgi:death-on-curing protein
MKSPERMPITSPRAKPTLDGNKRTGVQAALDFLEINGVDTSPLPELATYEAMIAVANHEMNRMGLAQFLRETLTG